MSNEIQAISQNNYILQAPPPTATMFTTELEYDGDKISGYAGSAFKAGTDLEFGYDSVDNISAINYSALTDANLNNIVQTNSGAWGGRALPISAGPGVKLQLVNNTLVVSNDETVLWEGTGTHYPDKITTNEPLSSFERFKVIGYIPYADNMRFCIENDFSNGGYTTFSTNQFAPSLIRFFNTSAQMLNDGIQLCSAVQGGLWLNTTDDTATVGKWYDVTRSHYIQKVIGINRK